MVNIFTVSNGRTMPERGHGRTMPNGEEFSLSWDKRNWLGHFVKIGKSNVRSKVQKEV